MRLYKEEVEIKSEGTFSGGEAKIKASAHAFAVLSKGLYSDPHLAIVRELCCNAWDSHVAAGTTDKKFDLYLPNALAPTFKVRDYGTGIATEAAVLKMYDYFDSSKQQSDEMTGCFGLGAKSPYAYTRKFTTLNFYNGKVSHYISFINENGNPETRKMAEEDTDQPNGIEVSFNVEQSDFAAFVNAAACALEHFKVKPNVFGVQNREYILNPVKTDPLVSGDDWKLYGNGTVRAIMGNVAYPVRVDAGKRISKNAASMLYLNVEVEFPMGAFEVTPSREAIQWTEHSVQSINDKLESIYDAVLVHVNTTIQNAPSYWEACIKAQEFQASCFRAFITQMTYKGRTIKNMVNIHPEFLVTSLRAEQRRYSRYHRNTADQPRNTVYSYDCGNAVTPNEVKFYFADYKGAKHKIFDHVRHSLDRGEKIYFIQHFVQEKKDGKDVIVVDYDKSKLQQFSDSLGINLSDVQMVSSIPNRPRSANARERPLVGSKASTFLFNVQADESWKASDRYWSEYTCDLTAAKEGVYVEISQWQFRNCRVSIKPREFLHYMMKLRRLGIDLPNQQLIGVKTADLAKFEKAKNWKTLDDWIVEKLNELLANDDFRFAFHVLKHPRADVEFLKELTRLPRNKFSHSPTWLQMIDSLQRVINLATKVYAFDDLKLVWMHELDKKLLTTSDEAKALADMSVTRYPLIRLLLTNHYTTNLRPYADQIAHYVKLIDNEVTSCPSSSAST